MRVITVIVLLLVLFLGVVYGAFTATGSERIDMNGVIIGLCSDNSHEDSNTITSILVEGFQTGASQSQNVSIIINKNTTVYHKYGKNLVKANVNDLHPGQKIEIRFNGFMMNTYPPQVNATDIIILYDTK
ncbi:MAG TPA: hypothetical protein PL055_00440 [Methanobacterium sp.]|jgi:hypothetical protein|nr:MAG: hypothetical protein FGO69_02920 [Methanobacterium sp.]HPX77217.1 hypothetical protein [Methanobacterium sp.]